MRLVGDTIEFGSREMPLWNTISISGYHIREAGATALQELAFTLADRLEYLGLRLGRGTIQALAAVMGGTQSLHTNSWDEALALPSEKAARLALRTQQVIAHESGAGNTIDPLGGSFFVATR